MANEVEGVEIFASSAIGSSGRPSASSSSTIAGLRSDSFQRFRKSSRLAKRFFSAFLFGEIAKGLGDELAVLVEIFHALGVVTAINRIKMKLAAPELDASIRGVYLASEIRARLSSMTASERRKTLATADEATVSAVLSGPGYLSGLTPLEIEAARMGWATKRYPDELRRLQYLESIGDHLQRAGQLLLGYQMKVADQSLVAAARARSKVANDAIAAATG
jgi:hypothetical protein